MERTKTKIRLADGKERNIQHMMVTSFWHPDGTPMSAQQFMESLFGRLPAFFKDEDELRAIWSVPDTRKKLLQGLADKGSGSEQLATLKLCVRTSPPHSLFSRTRHLPTTATPSKNDLRG